MAGAEAPDPRDFESWEDAFKHPIPVVRGMEKKLRAGANENQEKLKTLVGVSYRELLGTAHTIIDANSQIHNVESLLVDVGRRCDSRIVNKIASNHVRLRAQDSSPENRQNRRASQLFLLQQALKIVGRLLRTHGSHFLAAKLLVVSRLLHKTLPQAPETTDIANLFGKRLISLRSKLLRHIDRRLEQAFTEHVDLVQELTGFALATSSAPSDVLRHYQHIRAEAIKKPLRNGYTNFNSTVVERFHLYFTTAREIKAVYPDLLQASLRTLSIRPLLDDPDIRGLDDLRLEGHAHWISPDVKHFTPWTRHDETAKSDVSQTLLSWSFDGFQAFSAWLKEELPSERDLQSLLALRGDVLQLWQSNKHSAALSLKQDAPGLDPREVLNELALSFTSQFKGLIEPRFTALLAATKESISDSIGHKNSANVPNWTLWNQPTISMSITNGAALLRETIVRRRSGHDENIRKMLRAFQKGDEDIKQIQQIIKQMKDTRWEEDDVYGEDDMYPALLLADSDPKAVQKHLSQQASLVTGNLEEFLTERLSPETLNCHDPSSPALFLLRTIRELRQNIPRLLKDVEPDSAKQLIFSDIIAQIYAKLSARLVEQASPVYQKTIERYVYSKQNPRGLWEGTSPPLPVQITPATFQTMRATVKEMEAFGPDVWSPDAAAAVRDALEESFAQIVERAIDKLEELRHFAVKDMSSESTEAEATTGKNGSLDDADDSSDHVGATSAANEEPEGDDPGEPTASMEQATESKTPRDAEVDDKLVQLLFDATYLSTALSSPNDKTEPNEEQEKNSAASQLSNKVIPGLISKTGIGETSLARINKSATDYWRKTYLLFGLLCG